MCDGDVATDKVVDVGCSFLCQVKRARMRAWSRLRLLNHYFIYACHRVLVVGELCPERERKKVS